MTQIATAFENKRENQICDDMLALLVSINAPVHRLVLLTGAGIASPRREPLKSWVSFYWCLIRLNERIRSHGIQVERSGPEYYQLVEIDR